MMAFDLVYYICHQLYSCSSQHSSLTAIHRVHLSMLVHPASLQRVEENHVSYTAVLAICVDQEWIVMLGKGIEVPDNQWIFEIIVAAGRVASPADEREADLQSQAKIRIVHPRSVRVAIVIALYHLHDQVLSSSQVAVAEEGWSVDLIEEVEADLVGIKEHYQPVLRYSWVIVR